MDQASGKIRSPWRRAKAASTPMPKAPVMFTTMVPQGNVSPMARATSPDTKNRARPQTALPAATQRISTRSEEHTSELQVTNAHLVCRLLLEKKNKQKEKRQHS